MDLDLIRLVLYIAQNEGVKPAEFAEEFDVSVRTVRNHVQAANRALEGIASIDLERGQGYSLTVRDATAFETLLKEGRSSSSRMLPQTPDARVLYLLNDLLSRGDYITIDALSSVLFVSRASISSDLKQVEARLSRFGLSLDKRSHHGIKVIGSEMAKRLCLASLAMESSNELKDVAGISACPDEYRTLLHIVSECVDSITAEERFAINSVAYRNLITHIVIALLRIREHCYVPMEGEQMTRIRESASFPVACRVAGAIESRTGVVLPEEETAYIAIHLAGKQLLEDFEPAGSNAASGVVISDGVWGLVGEMLDAVWRTFRFDFHNDLELRMNLARHLVPLEVRLRHNMRLDNPILGDIKDRFPLAYSMGLEASSALTRRFGSELSEDEVGYIALSFALALERQKTDAPKKSILVVCATGAGSARLLEHRYRQEFGSYVDRIETCDAAHVRFVDFSNIDYVFSTVPLESDIPVPVCQVSYFLDSTEAEHVREILLSESENASAFDLFRSDLFFPHVSCSSLDEAIDFLCRESSCRIPLAPDFRELVYRREQAAPTSFGNRVAMPHPIEAASNESFVAVALLDEPVLWGGRAVEAVFLVSIAKEADDVAEGFFGAMSELVLSEVGIDELLTERTWQTLARLLSHSESRAAR